MKKLYGTMALVMAFGAGSLFTGTSAAASSDSEIVRALNIQNRELNRIADSLERISGQQPGWKLPK